MFILNNLFNTTTNTTNPASDAYIAGQKLKSEIDSISNSSGKNWQHAALKKIRHSRFEKSYPEELERLRGSQALTKDRESKIKANLQNSTKALIGQAFEIKDIYQKTHHVFLHAQESQWLFFPILVKALVRKFQPDIPLEDFKFLRLPNAIPSENVVYREVNTYINEKKGIEDHSSDGDVLLSADAYFYNNDFGESFTHFLNRNESMVKLENNDHYVLQAIDHFCPNLAENLSHTERYMLFQKLMKIFKPLQYADTGNLYAICIPKKLSHTIQYQAHSHGKVCKCHTKQKHEKILNDLQDENLDRSDKCHDTAFERCFGLFKGTPQFRLYTPLLLSEKGIKIHLMTSVTKQERSMMKKELQELAEALYQYETGNRSPEALKQLMAVVTKDLGPVPFVLRVYDYIRKILT